MKLSSLIEKTPLKRFRRKDPVVAVLQLHGVIAPGQGKLRGEQINLANMAMLINDAFETKGLKAVALSINSPGGSPVQSSLIAKRIRQLADEKKIPVYAFAEDVMASGGYWLGLCADEIYADQNSVIGSIGVISAGFGFTGLMEKLGVERRMHAAGDNKAKLDPFSPEKEEDVDWLKKLQAEIHDNFKAFVKERRGERLKKRKDKELFSGDVWTGPRAEDLGLIDGIADLRSFMREKYGDKVKFKLLEGRRSWIQRTLGLGSHSIAAESVGAVIGAARSESEWSRYGL
ncbi:S49 family peptidase [Sneathiella chinensis]|uniref:Serine protease n=1 Tax=Sneathiella chinensis TaxID=349750 RepID=A0ABQ5U4T5_9PROT|nr:S49 family peptidase [Sneathiella chinensis]GLQ06411.1 serine protease [Sneathiella chinensis]